MGDISANPFQPGRPTGRGLPAGRDVEEVLVWPLPAAMAERAARFADGGGTPAVPRVAATVVLLRETASRQGYEVYAIRRAATMVFGGVYAFPGGGVDPSDEDAVVGWAGPPPEVWAERLRLPVGQARAVVCAAARELFEESGVLLAGPTPDTVLADAAAPGLAEARRALAAREQSLTGFLAGARLILRSDLLLPWSRWITPDFEPRRFDTYFFLALLPDGQHAGDVSGEADHALWIAPADAVAGHAAGELPMLPPTAVTLRQLAGHGDVVSVLAAAAGRDAAVPVRPRVVLDRDGTAKLALAE